MMFSSLVFTICLYRDSLIKESDVIVTVGYVGGRNLTKRETLRTLEGQNRNTKGTKGTESES